MLIPAHNLRFVCPKCKKESDIFIATTGGAQQMAKEFQLPFLGQIPLDHRLTQSCDEGMDFFELYSDSATASAFIQLVKGFFFKSRPNKPVLNYFI